MKHNKQILYTTLVSLRLFIIYFVPTPSKWIVYYYCIPLFLLFFLAFTQVCGVTFHYYGIDGGCNYNELDRRVSKGCVPQATCQGLDDSNVNTCVDREVESPACSSCCDSQYCNYFPLANPDYRKWDYSYREDTFFGLSVASLGTVPWPLISSHPSPCWGVFFISCSCDVELPEFLPELTN